MIFKGVVNTDVDHKWATYIWICISGGYLCITGLLWVCDVDCRASLTMTVLRLAMTTFPASGTLPPMGYGSQRTVLLFKCAACAVVLSFAGVARSYGGACCLCEAVRPWHSMPVTPRNLCNSARFAGWIAASLCSSQ